MWQRLSRLAGSKVTLKVAGSGIVIGSLCIATQASPSLAADGNVFRKFVEAEEKKPDISKSFGLPKRQQLLNALKGKDDQGAPLTNPEFDLLIVGGGATGVGCALDAASRGLKVALVERDDFSSGKCLLLMYTI